ncbi:MAG: CotH kinase family protein [Chitinispirillia bacterium]|nr:CotH kinase family protein [Chitinispirillia bacterium]
MKICTIKKLTIFTIAVFFSAITAAAQTNGLPVIRINTENGDSILNKEDWVTMTFSLTDPNNSENNIGPISNQQIRGRGNSTWFSWPKKPYRIRFRNSEKQSPFGLPAARNWVLIANYYDLSLMKTSVAFELGHRFGLKYTCSYHHVDFYLNGVYEGSYLFTEHRQADPDGHGAPGRVPVDLYEGWFAEIAWQFNDNPRFRTTDYNLPMVIKSPSFEPELMTNPAYNFVRDDWNELTRLMNASNFPENGYRDLIDLESFVKYIMVQVISNNSDFNVPLHEPFDTRRDPGSIFFYKDKGGKIFAGPLWDFDLSFGTSWFSGNMFGGGLPARITVAPTLYPYPNYPFFRRFFDDPVFVSRWVEVWNENYSENIATMSSFIDKLAEKLRRSAQEDNRRWWPANNFDTRVSELKNYYETRTAFLNTYYNEVTAIAQSNSRIPPDSVLLNDKEAALAVSKDVLTNGFTAGPNPVNKSSGTITFFYQGKSIKNGTFTIYDASGNTVSKIRISGSAVPGNSERRAVGSWDLTDRRGRKVSAGTYLVKGMIIGPDGRGERVAAAVGVMERR